MEARCVPLLQPRCRLAKSTCCSLVLTHASPCHAAAQMKAFIDSTGGLWQSGALVGKPASVFVSVGTQGGGIETTALTFYTQLAHHGMVIVPTGGSLGSTIELV